MVIEKATMCCNELPRKVGHCATSLCSHYSAWVFWRKKAYEDSVKLYRKPFFVMKPCKRRDAYILKSLKWDFFDTCLVATTFKIRV